MNTCHACGYEGEWETLCADGDVCWPGPCPQCQHVPPPTRYGEVLTVERALELEWLAQRPGALHYG